MKHLTLCLALFLPAFLSAQWTQVGDDIDGPQEGSLCGFDVDISSNGKTLVIGCPYYGSGDTSGQVRVYREVDGNWNSSFQITNIGDTENAFGRSVAISADGTRIAVGANHDNHLPGKGFVEVYHHDNGSWSQLGQRIISDQNNSLFGTACALSADGKRLAIGASKYKQSSGLVRVYEEDNGQWQQIGNDLYGTALDIRLGYSLAMSADGERVASGSPHGQTNGGRSGYAVVYAEHNGSWSKLGQYLYGQGTGFEFGYSLSLSSDGKRLAVGQWRANDTGPGGGNVLVFKEFQNNWFQIGDDIPSEYEGDNAGYSVSLSPNGQRVAVGAIGNDDNGEDAGHVRIYEEQDDSWTQLGGDIDGEAAGDQFGWSVSMSNERVVIGTPSNDGNGELAGHVRVFDYSPVAVDEADRIESLDVYPNPTSGQVSLDLGEMYSSIDITVRTVTGMTVSDYHFSNRKTIAFDINASTGVYFLDVVLDGDKRGEIKIVRK